MKKLGLTARLALPYEEAIEKVTAALKSEGFGVLTTIDVKETMRKKLDVDFQNFTILGACNPTLAYKALTITPEIGLLLPCNVTVYSDGDGSMVNIFDPSLMADILQDPALKPVAEEALQKLKRVKLALQA